jgi:hypothetical protein
MDNTIHKQRLEVISNYIALRCDQVEHIGDPTETLNKLCEFFADDAFLYGRDGQQYRGREQILKYLAAPQPAVPMNSAPVRDEVNTDEYKFTLTFSYVKNVNVVIRFEEAGLKFEHVSVIDGGVFDGVMSTLGFKTW